MTQPISAEHSAILSCLKRIRMRLFTVRLAERLAIALTLAALVALFITAPRLIQARYLVQAALISAVPLAAATWLFLKADHLLRARRILVTWGLTPNFIRLLAIITALVSLASIAHLIWPFTPKLPIWAFPVATIVPFLITAAATVRPAAPETVAIFVDQQVGLKERVSTALELVQQRGGTVGGGGR